MLNSALPSSCEPMLYTLQHCHGIDFRNYSPSSLLRRITLRMQRIGITDYAAYAEYLSSAPEEPKQLISTILINHTAFFRDPDVWASIAADALPRLVAARPPDAPLRVWSAGCASGQEPYSLAMLLAELLGLEQMAARVTIYATDVDADALQHVRHASYHPWHVRMVPPRLLERYFVPDHTDYVVREELRRAVVVRRQNLLVDAPPPRIDLLLCRNVLIYLKPAAQQYVVGQLCDALADHGVLAIGKTELVHPAQHGLEWLSRRHRIMAKMPETVSAASYWQAGDRAST